MKQERILRVLCQVEERYIAEADPEKKQKRKSPALRALAAAACVCLCAVGAFRLFAPGMGKDSRVSHLAAAGEDLYYSVQGKGAYYYENKTQTSTRLLPGGLFFETPSGVFLYEEEEKALYRMEEKEAVPLGRADAEGLFGGVPELLDVKNDFAYWVGSGPENGPESLVVKTPLAGGGAETVREFWGRRVLTAALLGETLYYYSDPGPDIGGQIGALPLSGGKERILYSFGPGVQFQNRVFFTPEIILLSRPDGLYSLGYEGAGPEFLSPLAPTTNAFDWHGGRAWFYTAVPQGDFYRDAFVWVDPATKETGEQIAVGNGVSPYTYREAVVCDGGCYFVDPQKGLFYHSFAENTDLLIQKD